MTAYKTGDRVVFNPQRSYRACAGDKGTVAKYIPAQGSFVATCVVEWDDDSRGTVWASDLIPEGD